MGTSELGKIRQEEEEEEEAANESSHSSSGEPSTESGSGSGQGYIADWASSDSSSGRSSNSKSAASSAHVSLGRLNLSGSTPKASSGEEAHQGGQPKGDDAEADSSPEKSDPQHKQQLAGAVDEQQQRILDDILQRSGLNFSQPESMLLAGAILPQWNGVRIENPMDPRIDLSTVGYINTDIHEPEIPSAQQESAAAAPTDGPMPYDHYLHLLEAVRPFFLAYGAPPEGQAPQQSVASDEPNTGSSEGFTSFFTTTHTGTSDSNSHSESREAESRQQSIAAHGSPGDESDNSSMRVLARVKRRHRRQDEQEPVEETEEQSDHPDNQDDQDEKDQAAEEGNGPEDPVQDSLSSSSSDPPAAPQHVQPPNDDIRADLQRGPISAPPRIVSESSDSVARQSSQSGFSSTGNTGTGSSACTGSNGSSGSGNENSGSNGANNGSSGSGNEGKSEENSAHDGNSNSDENVAKAGTNNVDSEMIMRPPPARPPPEATPKREDKDSDILREQKILDKKRKRMSMRREYEEQVQRDLASSDSSDTQSDLVLCPGLTVALDEVLSFSKKARIIVQSAPPYLVVHANAAYTGLTGVDSHALIGQPISGILSLPSPSSLFHDPTRSQQSEAEKARSPAISCQGDVDTLWASDQCVDRLIVESGFDDYHVVNVAANPHSILGKNVHILQHGPRSGGSRESSLTGEGKGAPQHSIQCRVCICPITTSAVNTPDPGVVTDYKDLDDTFHQHSSKRRKHHHQHHHYDITKLVESTQHAPSPITHYVVQLEHVSSDSSVDSEAMSETVLHSKKVRPQADTMEEEDASSDRTPPVAAIG